MLLIARTDATSNFDAEQLFVVKRMAFECARNGEASILIMNFSRVSVFHSTEQSSSAVPHSRTSEIKIDIMVCCLFVSIGTLVKAMQPMQNSKRFSRINKFGGSRGGCVSVRVGIFFSLRARKRANKNDK